MSIITFFPKFFPFKSQHIKVDIKKSLDDCYNVVDQIISQKHSINWDTVYYPLMIVENELQRVWSPVVHLYSVQHNNLELRKVYEYGLFKVSEYRNWINQNYGLYKCYQSLYRSDAYQKLSIIQKKTIDNVLSRFKLSGVLLSLKKKKCYRNMIFRLSQLSTNYVDNVFNATLGWHKLITDQRVLSGIPHFALEMARLKAKEYKKKGWLFTLQYPSYSAIISHCDTAELREELYWAFNTRASDQGPNAGKWDNTLIMKEILALRYESSKILGFNSYLEKSLKKKMVQNSQQVFNFLINLYKNVRNDEKKELLEIQYFAKKYYSCNCLKPWDIEYFREKQKQHFFCINHEALRLYFPENVVLDGMFSVVNDLYNITIKQRDNIDTWNADVRFFDIYDDIGEWRGGFYLDLYMRKNKYEGAWMGEFVSLMYRKEECHQRPITYLICNFELLKNDEKLCLLTHNDVVVLFHEFGHVLHHIMTRVDIPEISGINGVPQDAVELPSQIMEKFCWEPYVLRLISNHCVTKKSLSDDIIINLLKTKMYQASSYLLRQVIYGLFDLCIHHKYIPENSEKVFTIFNKITKKISMYPIVDWDRFTHSFVHIFSNDYAAGYYTYLWSEMLVLNIWKKFQVAGIFNIKVGKLFLKNVLEVGISIDALKCLTDFCQEKITIEPMLQYYRISNVDKKILLK